MYGLPCTAKVTVEVVSAGAIETTDDHMVLQGRQNTMIRFVVRGWTGCKITDDL